MNNCKTIFRILIPVLIVCNLTVIPKMNQVKVQAAWDEGLIWSDEFNGSDLDKDIWNYEFGNGQWGWGNGEVECYTDRKDNVKVEDGYLKIIAKKESYGRWQYTSGRITTKGKKSVSYGLIEAKIKVENGNQDGVWPAFWMMGANMEDGVIWPNCGEIDIMEHANSNNYVGGCLHWNTAGLSAPYSSSTHGAYGSGYPGAQNAFGYFKDNENDGINGWHIYGLLWDEKHMEWLLDGVPYLRQSITANNAYCFQKPQFFLFNLAIGGPDTGFTDFITANENTFQTTTMYVDYLRAYQLGSEGSVAEELSRKELQNTTGLNTTENVSVIHTDMGTEQKVTKVTVASALKKKSAKTVKVRLKQKIGGAKGYQVYFYQRKKDALKTRKVLCHITYRKNRNSFTVKHKKLAGQSKVYVCIRAYKQISGKQYYGKWSTVKKVKIR